MRKINFMEAAKITSPNPLMLVCTKKEDGTTNMAPVSFFSYVSINPMILSFSMRPQTNSSKNFLKTKKAIIVLPGSKIKKAVEKYGSMSGNNKNKLEIFPIETEIVEEYNISIPKESCLVFFVNLSQSLEIGDHNLYICNVEKIMGDETKETLFAWDAYNKIETI